MSLPTGLISEHFAWTEAYTTSQPGMLDVNRNALANDQHALLAIEALCVGILEPIRRHFGSPLRVHSMYRCPALNTLIGGSPTSQHKLGEACDFHVDGHALQDVYDWIRDESGLPYGQVILEGAVPSWVHVSLGEPWRPIEKSRQALLWDGHHYSTSC